MDGLSRVSFTEALYFCPSVTMFQASSRHVGFQWVELHCLRRYRQGGGGGRGGGGHWHQGGVWRDKVDFVCALIASENDSGGDSSYMEKPSPDGY